MFIEKYIHNSRIKQYSLISIILFFILINLSQAQSFGHLSTGPGGGTALECDWDGTCDVCTSSGLPSGAQSGGASGLGPLVCETEITCPDCSTCGDGICTWFEFSPPSGSGLTPCTADCPAPSSPPPDSCGNGYCDRTETWENCNNDCAGSQIGNKRVKDGICGINENYENSPEDCKTIPSDVVCRDDSSLEFSLEPELITIGDTVTFTYPSDISGLAGYDFSTSDMTVQSCCNINPNSQKFESNINGFIPPNGPATPIPFLWGDLSPGDHTIDFQITDDCGNTIRFPYSNNPYKVTQRPIANIIIQGQGPIDILNTQSIILEGTITELDGDDIVEYYWNSDLDGPIFTDTSVTGSSLTISDEVFLQRPGTHIISLIGIDEYGAESDPEQSTTNNIQINVFPIVAVNAQPLGAPAQVIPRLVSQGNSIRTYSMPPGYGNYLCVVKNKNSGQIEGDCDTIGNVVEACKSNGLPTPTLEFALSGIGDREFIIDTQTIESNITVGSIQILQPTNLDGTAFGAGGPFDLGTLNEAEFFPNGKFLDIDISQNIIPETVKHGIGFQIYRVQNCELTPIGSLLALEPVGTVGTQGLKTFSMTIPKPQDCQPGETCTYIGELMFQNPTDSGGGLFTFDFEPQIALTPSITLQPTSTNLGSGLTGEQLSGSFVIINSGNIPLTGINLTHSDELSVQVNQSTLSVGENTTVSVSINLSDLLLANSYTNSIIINTSQGVQATEIILYTVSEPAPPDTNQTTPDQESINLSGVILPSSWHVSTISLDSITEKTFTILVNDTIPNDSSVTVFIEPDIAYDSIISVDQPILNLFRLDSIPITVELEAKELGTFSTNITAIFSLDDEQIDTIVIPITYTVIDDIQELIDSTKQEAFALKNECLNLETQAGIKSKIAKLIADDILQCKLLISNTDTELENAQSKLDENDREGAKSDANSASSKLSSVSDIIDQISTKIAGAQAKGSSKMIPISIAVGVSVLFGGLFFAFREGILNEKNVPWLYKLLEEVGLHTAMEGVKKMDEKHLFAPHKAHQGKQNIRELPKTAQGKPGIASRQLTPNQPTVPTTKMSPAQKQQLQQQWNEYYKQHPKYAKMVQQRYSSSYHRRFR